MGWPFGGGGEEKEEEESLVKKVTSQAVDYLFSLVVPVGILLYVAPQKSLTYIVDNAKEQVSAITEFDFEVAWNATLDLVDKTVPILKTEGEAISHVAEQAPGYFVSIYESPWKDTIIENWEWAAGALVVLAIIMALFPWGKLVDWVAQSAWRTVMLFVGVLPLDDGLDSISDNETGTYDIVIVAGSVLLTLAINYAALLATYWLLKKAILLLISGIVRLAKKLLAKQLSWVWAVIQIGFGKVFRRKKAPKEDIKEE